MVTVFFAAIQLMETWDVEKTASWLCEIGLQEKYATICRKEDINGRALLLLACKYPDQLRSAFQLKTGPETILMQDLEPHLDTFEPNQPQTPGKPQTIEMMSKWTVKQLCSWLDELGTPKKCLVKAEEEEISGRAFLLLRDSNELETCLQLKLGSWIVLHHELLLHQKEQSSGDTSYAKKEGSTNIPSLPMPTKQIDDSKAPLSAKDPSTKSLTETLSNPNLSKEEEKQFLLENALKLNIKPSGGSQHKNTCLVRSIFVKRGKGANALEKLLNFIVITRHEELTADNARKLWAKIRGKTPEWIKLLPEKDSTAFHWDEESKTCLHRQSLEEVSLRDGSVGQILLEKISDDEYKKSCFVVLVDKQLLEDKITYSFSFDKKHNRSYNIKLHLKDSEYHASFDANNPGLDFKWSKYFRSLKPTASDTKKTVSTPSQSDEKPLLTQDTRRLQSPRPFNSEVGTPCKFYRERSVLNCWETGPKDMITPVHEFKLFRVGVNSGEDDSMKKFVYETLRFACGCLNERTNGTIHFGVADEVPTQTCGNKPREIVGSSVSNKPLYNEKLTEFIDKCFAGESRSNVHSCIRPPVFVPVEGLLAEQQSNGKVVIEVDIEPSYSLCKGDIFKVGFKALDRGKPEREANAYVRHGSQTKAIVNLPEMEDFIQNRLPKLDDQRKIREQAHIQSVENQIPVRDLFNKLKRLLCANKKVLDSSVYPILVLSKPDASMNQEILDKTFRFVQKIKWLTVFDFDDHGTDSKGLCKVFKSGPDTPQCDIHEAEDYDEDDNVIEDIYCKTHWIFGNGYAKLGKEAFGFKQWNNSTRKRGLSQVIQSLAKTIPKGRAVVLFLLLSKDYQPVADTFKDFCTFLNGPNQLVYVAENSEIVSEWEKTLSNTCLEEHELRDRGVVGMSWTEFQECMQQMVCGTDRDQRYVTMATGSPCPLGNVSFNGIEIVSAKECEELNNLSSVQRSELSSKQEINFYRGYPVTWMNFWFTDAQKNHVLRRDNYSELRNLIEKLHSRGTEGKVQTITVYHHIGAGASTMTRQALWDFRHNPQFPYRCVVVTKIDDNTCKELLYLRKIGYGEQSEVSLPPVLALVENTDDVLFREFRSQVVEQSAKLARTDSPVCVFLYCKPTQKPQDCYQKAKTNSVFLEQHLSQNEVNWFKDKYTEMKRKSNNKDPEKDFEIYASENLISFMIMKENYNPRYASSIVGRNLDLVTRDELTLLEYTSLLSLYNPYPVFTSCFDMLMLSSSLLRKRIFRDWVENLTHSARIFLREVDCSPQFGTGKAIAIVHPIIAGQLVDQIVVRKQTTVSRIILDFLKSSLLQSQGKSFTSTYLLDGASRMLKQRKKYEYGDDVQTKFSPLIEKILYVKDAGDGSKEPTEQSIHEAAGVLREGLDKFEDPMLAQQMARVFYVNAAAFSTSRIEDCFNNAFTYCNMAIERNSNDRIKSFLFDTMGRIFQSKIKILFDPIRNENRGIVIKDVTPVLSLAFEAMKWFQKSHEVSVDQHPCGFRGELFVMFYMLDVLRCTGIFRGREGLTRLRGYLAYCQVIPTEVQEPWSEFHELIKHLKNRFTHCMEGLAEEFTVYKGSSEDAKLLPKQIARLKAQYHCYFGNGDMKWNLDNPEERWEQRWYQINQHLAGDIFSSVFKIRSTESQNAATETVLLLKKLAYENYQESVHVGCYKDLLLIVTTNMALHSPLGNSSRYKPAQSAEEYREVFKFVDKLFALEKCDESCKRIYAHLFKVMFLWPHKDQLSMLSDYRVEDFYDALKKLRKRWESKSKEHTDTDTKMQRQKVYKNMSFKKETKQYTTLFYLGKGTGLDAFVHINELTWSRTGKGSPDWEDPKTKQRLKRLTGVVESKNIITMKNPLDSKKTIEIYYSSFREGGFSKEEVSFFLGFSWPRPIALDVKYTSADNVKHSMEFKSTVFSSADNQIQPGMPNYVLTYEDYTNRMGKLMKKLSEIESLKGKKNRGEDLEETQVTHIHSEGFSSVYVFFFLF